MMRDILFLLVIVVLMPCAFAQGISTNAHIQVVFADNICALGKIPSDSVDLIYVDPPFNTGKRQERKRFKLVDGEKHEIDSFGYDDSFDDYLAFLKPRMKEAYRILKKNGSIFLHLDYREVHYAKVMMDDIFGRPSFMNEIIWVYDFGGRSKTRWSAKHDNILWYAKNPNHYTYNFDDIDRIPYMAPGLVGEEKARRGKTPTDVWWNTIVSPTGKEKTGYATQKPIAILERIVKVHSNKNDLCLDFFAGSGTLGEAAVKNGRRAILIDNNPDAISIMRRRFSGLKVEWIDFDTQKD